jgi:transcription-repair coupling factor (superfamily II helicase)
MDIYRRIALIRDEDESDEMISELIDRYGDPPSQVIALINIALLRCDASKAGIKDIAQKSGRIYFKLEEFDMNCFSALYALPEYKNRLKLEAGAEPVITLKLKSKKPLEEAGSFVKDYASKMGVKSQPKQ